MRKVEKERRVYQRYDTDVKVYFRVTYDIKTKVKFQILDTDRQKRISRRYSGISRNVSIEGLSFVSKKKLEEGDMLFLEVFVPNTKVPVPMEGEVQWSKKLWRRPKYKNMFHTGVKLISVNGKSVADSIRYDGRYKIFWSIVLGAVFGNFKAMVQRTKGKKRFQRYFLN